MDKMERLSDRRVRQVKAEDGKRLEIRDTIVRGLELRVSAAKQVKSWSLLYTDKRTGKKRRFGLGTYPTVSLEEARTRAKEEIAAIARGGDPAMNVAVHREALTFRQLADQRLVCMAPSPGQPPRRSVTNYRSMLDRHINPVIGDMKACDIVRADIKRLVETVRAAPDARFCEKLAETRKRRNPTILDPGRKVSHHPARVYELVRSIFRWAVGEELLDVDPTSGMRLNFAPEQPRDRNLTPEEIVDFWSIVERSEVDVALRCALFCSLATGQRIGELLKSCWKDIEGKESISPVLVIRRENTKNKKRKHRVPLSPLALALMRQASTGSGPIFPSPQRGHTHIGSGSATRAMGRIRPKLLASDMRVHDLRRTASNGMRRLEIDKFIVSLVLNHASAMGNDVTANHYLDEYSFESDKREALTKWGAHLVGVVEAGSVRLPVDVGGACAA